MKKLLILLILSVSLIGCSLSNTPTSKVEELMTKYQTVDDDIKDEIEIVLTDETLTLEQKRDYRDLIEKQYKNMSYEVKEEIIDGDKAIVTVAIEVVDYKKVIQQLENQYIDKVDYSIEDYNTEKIAKLKEAKEKVTYTLDIEVSKTSEGEWKVDNLSNIDKKKIQGMY